MQTLKTIICFFIFNFSLIAGNLTPDSLLKKLYIASNDTLKVKALIKIVEFHKNSNIDTALIYLEHAENISNETNYLRGKAYTSRLRGFIFFLKGDFKLTLSKYQESLIYFKELKDTYNIGKLSYLIGVSFVYLGDYKYALNNFFEALQIFEKNNFGNDASDVIIAIANVYGRLKYHEKELEFNNKALVLKLKLKDEYGLAAVYLNIGNCLAKQKKFDEAKEYAKKTLQIAEKLNNTKWQINANGNLGTLYALTGDFKTGLKYFLKSIAIAEKNNDNDALSTAYGNVGKLYTDLKQQAVAKNYYDKALEISLKTGNLNSIKENYFSFYEYYMVNKDYKNAIDFFRQYVKIKDSLLNESTYNQLNELQTKYETVKKEKENQLLLTQNKLSTQTIKRQKKVSYFITGGLIIVSFLAFFIFKVLKKQRLANKIISQQKQQVEYQKLLVDQHQKEILDSIHYAKRIQNAMLPKDKFIERKLKRL